ncbi:MAG: hypothetical protein LBQ58_03560 [Synergistaceae bacterium]|jgi:hypothetical protein|nr:hypothetical protein [Synergistaceae bacterium]
MRKIFVLLSLFLLIFVFFAERSYAAYRIGGVWRVEGEGFAEKNFLRVSLRDEGRLYFTSHMQGDEEVLTGYEMSGELNATGLGINAWKYYGKDDYDVPIRIKDFNPSMSEPLKLPKFTVDGLTYSVEFTSFTSGRINVRGYVDVDFVGRCEINGDNVIWKEGTPKPEVQPTESGCNVGMGWLALPFVFMPALRLRRVRR